MPGTLKDVRRAQRLLNSYFVGRPESAPYRHRFNELKQIRQPMEKIWLDVQRYLAPSLGRYLNVNDPNDNGYDVVSSKIIDSTATKMLVTAADGLHGGLTKQSEQWFSLYVGNYGDAKDTMGGEAGDWVKNAQNCERDVMAKSNFYSAVYSMYLEVLAFGCAVVIPLKDPESFVRYYSHTAGSYWLSQDNTARYDSVYLKFPVRAGDIVAQYGEKNCPDRVLDTLRDGNTERRFYIIQCIQPWNYFGNSPDTKMNWVYEDVRYIEGGSEDEKILYRGGYRSKPFVAVRWSDSGGTVYSRSCPGIDCLQDVKQLQTMMLDYNMAVKWKVDPAWVQSESNDIDIVRPGEIYKVTGDPRANLLYPLVTADFDLNASWSTMDAVRQRIAATLYNREILLVQSRTEHQLTATEVNQLINEKNTVLGPIIARMGDNALIPLLDRTFEIITDAQWNILPPAPLEIQNEQIMPYFTGELAKAQRQGGIITQMQTALQIAAGIAQLDQPSLANFDFGQMLRDGDEVDLFPAGMIRSKDEVEALQQQQAQAMQQQQQMAAMQQGAQIAKDAGQAKTSPDTLLGQMMGGGESQ